MIAKWQLAAYGLYFIDICFYMKKLPLLNLKNGFLKRIVADFFVYLWYNHRC